MTRGPHPAENRSAKRPFFPTGGPRVALPLTVAKLTCHEKEDPDILFLVRFHAQPGGAWHGSHDSILPQSALPCQRPNWQGPYRMVVMKWTRSCADRLR